LDLEIGVLSVELVKFSFSVLKIVSGFLDISSSIAISNIEVDGDGVLP